MSDEARERIRAAMAVDPQLLAFADALRTRYDAKMVYLKTPQLEIGKRSWPSPSEAEARLAQIREMVPRGSIWHLYQRPQKQAKAI